MRQDQGDGVVIGRAAGRGAGLLAEARHDQIGADRHARPRGRAERGGARRVVGVGRVAAPARALIAEHRGQYLLGPVPPARIAGAAVVFGAHRLGVDDRPLVAQLLDQLMVARRKIDVVGRVAAGGGAHVLGVERVLERKDDAVHRHLVERRIAAIAGIELGGAFERVGKPAELLARRRCFGRQRPRGRMPVEIAATGDRTLAADVQGGERVQLAGIGEAGDHAVLLVHRGVRGGRLHPAEFERRPAIAVEIGQDRRRLDGLGREAQRRPGAHRARGFGDRRAVFGDESAGDAVIGARPVEIALHNRGHGGLPGPDRAVQLRDRRLFELKRLRCTVLFAHDPISPPDITPELCSRRTWDCGCSSAPDTVRRWRATAQTL